jgi:hypothetical protein
LARGGGGGTVCCAPTTPIAVPINTLAITAASATRRMNGREPIIASNPGSMHLLSFCCFSVVSLLFL